MMRAGYLCLGVTMALGCAAQPARAPEEPVAKALAPEVKAPIDRGMSSVEGEVGGLNEEAVDMAFSSLSIEDCLARSSRKLSVIGGEIKIRLRIDRRGQARAAYLSASTLGDREAERCVLDKVRATTWPRPLGGDGLAEKSFALDAPSAPVMLDEARMPRDVARARARARTCRSGIQGSFSATLYIRRDGRVASAGVASPSEQGEGVADCIVEAIRNVRFRRVPARVAKLTFQIP